MELRTEATRLVRNRRRYGLYVLMVAVSVVATTCGSTEQLPTHPHDTEGLGISVGEGPYEDLIRDILNKPMAFAAEPIPEATRLLSEVFADGLVTFPEYGKAVEANVQCLVEAGIKVTGPMSYQEGGALVVQPGVDPGMYLTYLISDPSPSDDPVIERCDMGWRWHVEQVWLHQNAPTEDEIDVWLDRAWACAREHGIKLSDPPSVAKDLHLVVGAGLGCKPWEVNP